MSFARTKIQLPRQRLHTARPALEQRLAAALTERRLVLLCASAGYGKTSALAWQLAQLPAGVACAWIACDHDDTPLMLFEGLLAALEPFDLPWRVSPEALVARAAEADSPLARRALAAELINALDASEVEHGVIAIDDLHRIDAPPAAALVNEFLTHLLERGSARWTFAIATRSEPALPLARWRAAGELFELREDELRFSAAEARALASDAGGAAGDEVLARLLERTAGWPAGLGLALRMLHDGGPGAPATGSTDSASARTAALLARAERSWFELLTTEVIDRLSAPLRELLLLTSVLPELTPARAAAVSGTAQAAALLDELERRGDFVTVIDGAEHTLRLHDLLRDALAHRLRLERPHLLPELRRRAAAGEPDPTRRIGWLLDAGDWDDAEALLEKHAGVLLTAGARSTLQRLMDRFAPAEQQRPGLELARGLMAWARWDWAEMPRALRSAAAGYRRAGDARRETRALAYLAIAQSGSGDDVGMPDTLERIEANARQLELDAPTRCRVLLARLWYALHHDRRDVIGPLLDEQVSLLERVPHLQAWYENVPVPSMAGLPGTRQPLARYVQGVLRLAPEEPTVVRGMALVLRGWLEIHAGEWAAAERTITLAGEDCRWLAEPPGLRFQLALTRMQLHTLRGEHAAMRSLLQALVAEAARPEERAARALALPLLLYFGRRLAVQAGDVATFEELLARSTLLSADADRFLGPQTAQVHLAYRASLHGRHDEAAGRWRAVLAHSAAIGLYGQAIELPLRAADALLHIGRGDEVAPLVADVARRVRDSGEPGALAMAGLSVLRHVAASRAWAGEAADRELLAHWAERLAAWQDGSASPQRAAAPPQVTASEPASPLTAGARPRQATSAAAAALSEREAEVLALIAAGQSNKHIARTLDISPHTVKRHVANILDKLGLDSRGQAAAWHHAQRAGAR